MKTDLLVIGYGNELLGDDGVGPAVARAVENWPGVTAIVSHGLTPELAQPIAEADRVVFVDAHAGSHEVVVVEVLPAAAPGLGHASDPGWLLALAESLWGRRPRAWLIAVPAENFDLGEGLSPRAERGVQAALREVARLVAGSADTHVRC
jgi:hydrogenase maturation protease